jgi:hypothetical protein
MTLEAAIAYLRSRNKYLVDKDCKFTPTTPENTDIQKTIKLRQKELKNERDQILHELSSTSAGVERQVLLGRKNQTLEMRELR